MTRNDYVTGIVGRKRDKTVPSHLYKYRKIGVEGSSERRFLKRTFTHLEVYFASREEFNDPFDCKIVPRSFDHTDGEWLEWYRGAARKAGYAPEQCDAEAMRNFRMGRHRDLEVQRAIQEDIQRDANRLGIYCASLKADSLPMWARYGDGHRGLCLEFRHLVDLFQPLAYSAFQQVHYCKQLPHLPFLACDELESLKADLLTKSLDWQDEHECRLIDTAGSGARNFTPQGLSGVIFGCRTPEADRRIVREWIAAAKATTKLYECVIKDGEYAIEIRALD